MCRPLLKHKLQQYYIIRGFALMVFSGKCLDAHELCTQEPADRHTLFLLSHHHFPHLEPVIFMNIPVNEVGYLSKCDCSERIIGLTYLV